MLAIWIANTPNGRKAAIILEEVDLPYTARKIDLSDAVQDTAEFRRLNPNGKIPVLIGHDTDAVVAESGAVLVYLAEQAGQLLPSEAVVRHQVWQWLFFQIGNLGPIMGQPNHFRRNPDEKIPCAIERFERNTCRLFDVLDERLINREYLADEYSIADVATVPWIKAYQFSGLTLDHHPHLKAWHDRLWQRPAVARGMEVPESGPYQ